MSLIMKPIKYLILVNIQKPQVLINNFMQLITKLLIITSEFPIRIA